jgi:RHS repeat-associated protein
MLRPPIGVIPPDPLVCEVWRRRGGIPARQPIQLPSSFFLVPEPAGSVTVNVVLDSAASQTVSVGYTTVNNTALVGSDYTATSGTLTFAPGETSKPISVPIRNDSTLEGDEYFTLRLTSPVNAALRSPTETGIVILDDEVTPVATLSTGSVGESGGAGQAIGMINLSMRSGKSVSVGYTLSAGSATPGADFVATSGTVTFAPGEYSKPVPITVVDDAFAEPRETVTVTLGSPVGAQLGAPSSGTGELGSDDIGVAPYDESYTYNAIGNLKDKGARTLSYPAAGGARPHAVSSVDGQTYSYDAVGNLLSGGGRSLSWDAENRPASITSGGVTETYGYDADGERVSTTRGGTTTIFLEGLWEETVGSPATAKAYYGFNGQVVAFRPGTGAALSLGSDHLGSAQVVLNSAGGVEAAQEFDPWGAVRPERGAVTQTSRNYTGQVLDGTGLLYYHARSYDPGLGRFISPDPVVPDPTNPQDLNHYSYVRNNPLNYTDPSGKTLRSGPLKRSDMRTIKKNIANWGENATKVGITTAVLSFFLDVRKIIKVNPLVALTIELGFFAAESDLQVAEDFLDSVLAGSEDIKDAQYILENDEEGHLTVHIYDADGHLVQSVTSPFTLIGGFLAIEGAGDLSGGRYAVPNANQAPDLADPGVVLGRPCRYANSWEGCSGRDPVCWREQVQPAFRPWVDCNLIRCWIEPPLAQRRAQTPPGR